MNKYLLIIFLFSASAVCAQSKEVAAVEKAVADLVKAMVDGDESQLKMLTDPQLTYGHSNGLIENQSEFIHALSSGESNFTEITIENQTVDIKGKIALVRHFLIGATHNQNSDPAPVNLGVLTVWHKKGKNWTLLARQAYKR
ncbi:nuclear transport factor 2 family protein [Cyclobacterium jeungdonense]|uniref:Nuclear transport factor 2 family protein n=1 Tax=Cyclobacterium jeungdonense TaxID=708087 RepID=A0ABT8C1V6_9BACT|nr:nuclear transport factor 2 family protein [Cyclobacterium jeungdonense]MDN3686754.1 nuclear transport factor 2 family protein [Cyclobacterium jeungdonense]